MEKNFFVKAHGLGNDYVVLDDSNINFELTEERIIRICDYHFGIGSDGILLKVPSSNADFGLKIYNPDASEAEKSGNGLRIFCKYLFDYGFTDKKEFSVETLGGLVYANIIEAENNKARTIKVDMGKAIFEAAKIPVNIGDEEAIDQTVQVGDRSYQVNCVSVGNPHCVVVKDHLDEEEIKTYGPLLENYKEFPNRINVQFAKPISNNEVEALIWERGAGFTLASGSSSCAVACIMVKRGLTDRDVTIKMLGGVLKISIDEEWNIRMTGEVRESAFGNLSEELIQR